MAMVSLSSPPLSLSRNHTFRPRYHQESFGLTRRFLSAKICKSLKLRDDFRRSYLIRVSFHSFSSKLRSVRYDESVITCEGMCSISWSIEAEIDDDYIIFLTGDPLSLGQWDPQLAIPLSLSTSSTNLWETEIMVPYGVHFKYNYFITKKNHPSPLIIWRPGPEYSLSVPFACMEINEIRVRDSWIRDVIHSVPFPSWGSWIFDRQFVTNYIVKGTDEEFISGESNVLTGQNSTPSRNESPNPETINTDATSSLRDQPVEEPWLLLDSTKLEKIIKQKVSAVILINSSVCNMRRIAVLEEGKLVELILEPLKDYVWLNNIYLGVILEILPQMGGAYVEIGLSKPAFMIIREEREPFVYGVRRVEGENYENGSDENKTNKWDQIGKGTKIIAQVIEGELRAKGVVTLIPYPRVRSRFWVLRTRSHLIEVSRSIEEPEERARLWTIAKKLKPLGFGLKVRPVAAGYTMEELKKDLEILMCTWNGIIDHAKSAALVGRNIIGRAVPTILHRAMDQNLSVIQDYFPDKVESVLVDSPRSYHEVTVDLQEIAPELCGRVELYAKNTPIFYEFGIEEEINSILCKRVPLPGGGYLVIEQSEAFVSIDVNSGKSVMGKNTSQEKAALEVNLAAAKQIARELRLRDIGGIIIVDFIDMSSDSNRKLLYEEMKKEIERDRSKVTVSELSSLGLMEITRQRVHHSDSFMISKPCKFCHATGRVEALETSFSKIEHEISNFLAGSNEKPDLNNPKSWPRFLLRVDRHMCEYLTSGKRTKLAILSSSLKVWILLKIARGFSWGAFELTPLSDEMDKEEPDVAP